MNLFDEALDLPQKPRRALQVISLREHCSKADEVERDVRLPAELRALAERLLEYDPSGFVVALAEGGEPEVGESIGNPLLVFFCSEVREGRLELPSRFIK